MWNRFQKSITLKSQLIIFMMRVITIELISKTLLSINYSKQILIKDL